MISGRTEIVAHLGYPTESFTAPMIYNPWFAAHGVDAVVVPMGVKAENYAGFLRPLFSLANIRGALVTMPHKMTTAGLLDSISVAVEIAGSCNAILRRPGNLFPVRFGNHSFVPHLRAAIAARKPAVVLSLECLALDVDRPDDLFALAQAAGSTESQSLVRQWGFGRPNVAQAVGF